MRVAAVLIVAMLGLAGASADALALSIAGPLGETASRAAFFLASFRDAAAAATTQFFEATASTYADTMAWNAVILSEAAGEFARGDLATRRVGEVAANTAGGGAAIVAAAATFGATVAESTLPLVPSALAVPAPLTGFALDAFVASAGVAAETLATAQETGCNRAGHAAAAVLAGAPPCAEGSAVAEAANGTQAVLAGVSDPGPLPEGWEEHVLLDERVDIEGAQVGAGPTEAPLLGIDARRSSRDPRMYELVLTVAGQEREANALLMPADLPPFHQELLRLDRTEVGASGATAHLRVAYRDDPAQRTCVAAQGGACLVASPVDPQNPGWATSDGTAAVLTVEVATEGPAGPASSGLAVPLAGQAVVALG